MHCKHNDSRTHGSFSPVFGRTQIPCQRLAGQFLSNKNKEERDKYVLLGRGFAEEFRLKFAKQKLEEHEAQYSHTEKFTKLDMHQADYMNFDQLVKTRVAGLQQKPFGDLSAVLTSVCVLAHIGLPGTHKQEGFCMLC